MSELKDGMSRLAVFLGAGASKPFGYPLTTEILPLIVERLRARKLFLGPACNAPSPTHERDCEILLERLGQMFPGLSLADAQAVTLPQVTDVLSLLDRLMADGLGLNRNFSRDAVVETRRLMERAIAEVLDGPSSAPLGRDSLRYRRRWAQAIVSLARRGHSISVITTNYDLVFERAIYESLAEGAPRPTASQLAREIDYGFDWRSPLDGPRQPLWSRPREPLIRFYKLHGSLNWLRCEVCGYIYINARGAVYHQSYGTQSDVHNSCTCGAWPLKAVLVTPSSVREVRDFNLLSVWNSALEALRTADDWSFVGYSLPGEDVSIRSLLLRAYAGREPELHGPPQVRAYLFRDRSHETAVHAQSVEPSAEQTRYQALFPGVEMRWSGVLEHIDDICGMAPEALGVERARDAR